MRAKSWAYCPLHRPQLSDMKNSIASQIFIFATLVILAFIASMTVQYYALRKMWANSEAVSGNETFLTLAIAIVATMSVLITIFAFYWIKRRAIAPLQEIGQHIAAGNFTTDVPCLEQHNEIGDIAKSIHKLKKIVIDRENKRAVSENELRKRVEDEALSHEQLSQIDADRAHALQLLTHGLILVSQGDLSFRIQEQLTQEFEPLRVAFNQGSSALSTALSDVATTSANLGDSVSVVSQSSNDLSQHTQQQYTSLEHTAGAIIEVTTQLNSSSEQANHVQAIISQTMEDAEKSGSVVRTAIDAMTKIEESAQQINQIIGSMDEIAFQTNLLALNAGVEAARAGESGKGFAVVAQEVRELAGRSTKAAKEIKGLIDTSSQQVETGVSLVNETGDALQEIETRVSQINDIMQAIVQDTDTQSSALGDINNAMENMDQATKQSMDMVLNTRQSCSGLMELSSHLENNIKRFRLEHTGGFQGGNQFANLAQMPPAPPYGQPPQQQLHSSDRASMPAVGHAPTTAAAYGRPVENLQLRAVDNTYIPSGQQNPSPARSLGRRLAGAVSGDNQHTEPQNGRQPTKTQSLGSLNNEIWDEF